MKRRRAKVCGEFAKAFAFASALFSLRTRALADTQLGTVDVDGKRVNETPPADLSRADRDSVPLVTVVPIAGAAPHVASVADLLSGQAGVNIRSRGGLGAFTSVSLRGSDSAEVAILIDGVPLSRSASGLIDLSQIPIDGLDRVEIYRGAPPPELGSEAVGGAINLITRKGESRANERFSVGTGSFGARSVTLGLERPIGKLRVSATAAYRGAQGDFTYYDNGGTLFNSADDRIATRKNNDYDQGSADVTLRYNGRVHWELGVHAFLKDQGVPGLAGIAVETLHARLNTGRLVIDGAVSGHARRVDWRVGANFMLERVAFDNPLGEQVGPYGASVSEGDSLTGGLSGRVDAPWGAHQLISVIADARAEHRTPYDLLHPATPEFDSTRGVFGLALVDALRFFRDRLAFDPALRVDGITSSLAQNLAAGTQSSFFASPRLALRVRATSFLTLRASVGRFVRFPTLLEQFGDGAFLLAAKALQPESAWGGDVGAIASVDHKWLSLSLEAVFFGRAVENYITYVGVANALGAVNFGDTRVFGSELRASVKMSKYFLATLDYTYLNSENLSDELGAQGKELPYRAPHQLTARFDGTWRNFRAFYQLDYIATLYRDPENYNVVPGHALHALGVTFEKSFASLSVEVQNLADLRVVSLPLGGSARSGEQAPYPLTDFFGYPLPGRALYATLALRN